MAAPRLLDRLSRGTTDCSPELCAGRGIGRTWDPPPALERPLDIREGEAGLEVCPAGLLVVEQRHGVLDAERVQVEGGITFATPRVEPDGDLVTDASGASRVGEHPLRAAAIRESSGLSVLSVMLASRWSR